MVCVHGCMDSNNAALHQARSRGTRVRQCIVVVLCRILVLYDDFVDICMDSVSCSMVETFSSNPTLVVSVVLFVLVLFCFMYWENTCPFIHTNKQMNTTV